MGKRIIPVLLAGGIGSRLWPVSRKSYPKQFCKLFDEFSLLQKTAERAKFVSEDSDLIVVTNDNYYFFCKDQLEAIDLYNVHYVLESCSRNTAPAIALAAQYACEYIHPDSVLLTLPTDHYLNDHAYFKSTVRAAMNFVERNKLVVFGVEPQSPKAGYGYIEKGDAVDEGFEVKSFIEKPSLSLIKEFLLQGNFFWNSGLFLFKAKDYLNELEKLANDIYIQSTKAFQATQSNLEFFRVNRIFDSCRAGSIDYEVMEKTNRAVILPLRTNWSDLGCWLSVGEMVEGDGAGNVCYGDVMVDKCQNCLISSEGRRVVAIGVKDQVIVSTPDALLVIDKACSQEVKRVVEQMKLQHDVAATEHQRMYRPWGFYEKLAAGADYQVKCLMVNPGSSLSLQLHRYRSEHWVVVSGEAEVVKGKSVFRLHSNQSTFIEKGMKHRLSNPGDEPLLIIEVQSGKYLGEDDIVRLDDTYGRVVESASL
ncbi:mannose-1-phosphate guanylyltransferase/mannose-6-phosphate isomerase [Coxiella endosymbiont of Ornithodoros amblus]|uniref:mannose-1-phosphate guanylyltransferase/mannose-6-phosphate isomerase n=1 Tax=Coxiella endosymbiont of Ornithodoros amblus TaxID=1656166 RepID=UPI00244E01BC|nr:mannose-1-phosphate guanylyltransferase/mannose-6-phosphate isomerase [Coxiella endosymbiont of Ornithodoros amblus]MBW5802281.1 mannose-1-phosphate guanylyltransferase/mannose-6-phosphate isomerase [Coxiella endosymbiont of Ornithodoros amblus]